MPNLTEPTIFAAIVGALAAVVGVLAGRIASRKARESLRRDTVEDATHERVRSAAVELIDAAARVGQKQTAAHGDARLAYYRLLVVSSSSDVQRTARELLRTSWNVAEEIAGRERKREKPSPGMSASKEIRQFIRPLVIAVREETGLSPEIEPEPED